MKIKKYILPYSTEDIEFVNNQIMNQLSYEVLNLKFRNRGFKFKGNYNSSIKK